jgi:hypothetical protein
MATLNKQPFVYTLLHKYEGDQLSGNTTITNVGITKLTSQTTYTLAAPDAGALKTIYRAQSMSTVNTQIAAGSGISFNGAGGTQTLNLQPSTAAGVEDVSVTLLGESSTQWRVIAAWPGNTTVATAIGVRIST